MKKLLAVFLIILALPFGALAAGDADPLLQRAQSVLDALTNGRYSEISAQFDETMRAAVSEEAIAQGWEAILAQYGGYVGVETTQASSENRSVALTLAEDGVRHERPVSQIHGRAGPGGHRRSNGKALFILVGRGGFSGVPHGL